MNSNDSTKNKRRYTPEEKNNPFLISLLNGKPKTKRGAQKEAAERFGISTVTISSWMKASKAKRGRKPGTKNTTAPKTQPRSRPTRRPAPPGGRSGRNRRP